MTSAGVSGVAGSGIALEPEHKSQQKLSMDLET